MQKEKFEIKEMSMAHTPEGKVKFMITTQNQQDATTIVESYFASHVHSLPGYFRS
jgi:hypothetical protein